jgi:hypothetical protein
MESEQQFRCAAKTYGGQSFGIAGEYGVARCHVFSGPLPISPKSTHSPGAVFCPGALKNIIQYASNNASLFGLGIGLTIASMFLLPLRATMRSST